MNKRFNCRLCGSTKFTEILDYGNVALADSFLRSKNDIFLEKKYSLKLVICDICLHVQIENQISPELLFSNYVWETSISNSIIDYCKSFVSDMSANIKITSGDKILEIASNDGTLLQEFINQGFRAIGVDPAKNISEIANSKGLKTINMFFNYDTAKMIRDEFDTFELVVARNVVGHTYDLNGLFSGAKHLMRNCATLILEFPHLMTMFNEVQYDQVFHEHIGYHSLDSIIKITHKYSLKVYRVEKIKLHGGSLRVYITNDIYKLQDISVNKIIDEELSVNLISIKSWMEFKERVRIQKFELLNLINYFTKLGKTIVGYGASGKGQSMIQYCGINNEQIKLIADKSLMKKDLYTPGSHIKVCDIETMRRLRPDIIIIFTWNQFEEILVQEKDLKNSGTKFIHPLPIPHFI